MSISSSHSNSSLLYQPGGKFSLNPGGPETPETPETPDDNLNNLFTTINFDKQDPQSPDKQLPDPPRLVDNQHSNKHPEGISTTAISAKLSDSSQANSSIIEELAIIENRQIVTTLFINIQKNDQSKTKKEPSLQTKPKKKVISVSKLPIDPSLTHSKAKPDTLIKRCWSSLNCFGC